MKGGNVLDLFVLYGVDKQMQDRAVLGVFDEVGLFKAINKMIVQKDLFFEGELSDLDFEGINELSSDIFVEEFELNSTQNI
jgi:hypothetical protein